MKILTIFVAFTLNVIVKGAIWAAAARAIKEPILLSFGTVFAALGLDVKSNDDVPLFRSDHKVIDVCTHDDFLDEKSGKNGQKRPSLIDQLKDEAKKDAEEFVDKQGFNNGYNYQIVETGLESISDFRIQQSSMVQDDVEAHISRANLNNVNFQYFNDL